MVEMDSLQVPESSQKLSRIPSQNSLSSVKILRTSNLQNAVTAANLKDPSFNYDQLWKSTFYVKVAQWAITVICAALYSKGIELMVASITRRSLPYIVFFAYMLINSVVIISYIIKEKMPELLIRMFGFLGGVLFTVTGALSLQVWYVYKDASFDDHPPDRSGELLMAKVCLLTEGILDLAGALLYYVDTATSYYKSLNGIFI